MYGLSTLRLPTMVIFEYMILRSLGIVKYIFPNDRNFLLQFINIYVMVMAREEVTL